MTGPEEIKEQVQRAVAEAGRRARGKAPKAEVGQTGKAQRKRRGSFPFKVVDGFLCREVEAEEAEGGKRWVPFVSELKILARTRTGDGEGHGLLLELVDADRVAHRWPMPMAMLAGSGEAVRAQLLDLGLRPAAGQRKWREWLLEFLLSDPPDKAARCVASIAWHGETFVLPDETFGPGDGRELVILQTAAPLDHAFRQAGTLEGWQQEVAGPAVRNSRLVLAICAAFAAPLLALVREDGGGFHLRGASSVGKSTALYAAGSVWGGGGAAGYVRTWRATDNALETLAALHSGVLLPLDELAQVEPKAAGAAAYMLANGQGKGRLGKDGQARGVATWRLLFLSTGEISLGDKIREGGGQIAAGMEVRVVDLRADAGAGLGLFEDIHGAPDAAAFATALRGAAGRHYGMAGRAFLRLVARDLDAVRQAVAELRRAFLAEALPLGADGQVRRAADRFALVAAAGDLASDMRITNWAAGTARAAALRMFRDWIADRGGSGASEATQARQRVLAAIETFGQARFQKWHANADRAVITPRWGFAKVVGDDEAPLAEAEFYLLKAGLDAILEGMDRKRAVNDLVGHGFVLHGKNAEPNPVLHVPGDKSKHRLYRIDLAALRAACGQADDA